ncbi:MAG: hypothetical protein QNK19_11450 [Xanthomonadales bacterium]|nr:hypothetical protein [Xanthomonadales bacterium]
MRRVFKQPITFAMLLAALPVFAQMTGNNQTLVLPLSSGLSVNGMARVITSKGRPADCLAPLAVNRIDGEKRLVPAQGFLIEPGVHTLNGKAMLDLTNCPLTDSNLHISSAPDLEVKFERNGTYYIGYSHEAANTGEWKLVVWQIEKSP